MAGQNCSTLAGVLEPPPRVTDDSMRRRVYAGLSFICVVAFAVLAVTNYQQGQTLPLYSSVLAALLSAFSVFLASWKRLPAETFEGGISLAVLVGGMLEFYTFWQDPALSLRAYLSFTLMPTVWVNLLPARLAVPASGLLYLGFVALALTRPAYNWSDLVYFGCVVVLIVALTLNSRHLSREQREAATLHQQALTDPVTGLSNRRALMGRLQGLTQATQAQGAGLTGLTGFTLFMLDIDHFKRVNDRYGHTTGDEVLREVGLSLTRLAGVGGMVARWGGEEFMVLLPSAQARVAQALSAQLHQRLITTPSGLPDVTLSGGAAFSHERAALSDLLALVDQRLHAAKNSGRNQIKWDEQVVDPALTVVLGQLPHKGG